MAAASTIKIISISYKLFARSAKYSQKPKLIDFDFVNLGFLFVKHRVENSAVVNPISTSMRSSMDILLDNFPESI